MVIPITQDDHNKQYYDTLLLPQYIIPAIELKTDGSWVNT